MTQSAELTAKLNAETAEILARINQIEREAALTERATELAERAAERAERTAELEKRAADAVERAADHVSQMYALEYEVASISLARHRRDEALILAQWQHQHVFNFVAAVSGTTVQAAIERLNSWDVMDPGCDMTIIFNSPGGSVIDGMALFDYIRWMRTRSHKVTIIALGYAASMAGILLQAGDVRVMAKGSWLLIHEVAFGVAGKIGEIEDMYKFGERLKEQAATIFVERSGGKLTREMLEINWNRKDWWISPDEALALGLIDEIR